MASLDAVSIGTCISSINSSSKTQIVEFLSSMTASNLQHLLLAFLSRNHPHKPSKTIYSISSHLSTEHITECTSYIEQYFTNNNNISPSSTLILEKNPFSELPSDIGAYIISFNTMSDRLKHQSVCKHFYKFCQIPMAKSHLIIDFNFVKALYDNTIDCTKFYNVQHLDIKHVFMDSSRSKTKYGLFESLHYSNISQILSKSPNLYSINYDLKYNVYTSRLLKSSVQHNDGESGHLMLWINNIIGQCKNKHLFDKIKRLAWNPIFDKCGLFKYDQFVKQFPQLKHIQITNYEINRAKKRRYYYRCGDGDICCSLLENKYYYDKLQFININMTNQAIIDFNDHPLSHFYKFKKLKQLKLKLPMFDRCGEFYNKFIANNIVNIANKCDKLENISLEFVLQETRYVEQCPIINKISMYVLSFCTNLTTYSFIIEKYANYAMKMRYDFDHLIGNYDKIKCIKTNQITLLPNSKQIKLPSLKQFILLGHINIFGYDIMNRFPCSVESFTFILKNNVVVPPNKNIIQFLNYLSSRKKSMTKLKYVGLFDENRKSKKKCCISSQSEEICRLIISLMTSNGHGNNNISIIELNPLILKNKEINYLKFWFKNQFGNLETDIHASSKKKSCLLHLKCVNYD